MKNSMKKTVASGLIGLIALGGVAVGAPSAFAQDVEEPTTDESTTEERAARQEARAERRAERVEALTSVLGISADEFEAAREAGDSVADIAAAQGVDVQSVIDALVANAEARIEAKQADGTIDADRAAEKLESIEDRVTARVNGERPEGRRGR